MKVNATVKQPAPDEIINKFFASHSYDEIFVGGSPDCLTDDGKAILAIGITVWNGFNKNKR